MRSLVVLFARRASMMALALGAMCAALLPAPAAAHPLGNFTVNRYSRIEVEAEKLGLVYIVDMAEIPTLQERQRMDTNADGAVDQAEQDAYRDWLASQILGNVELRVAGKPLALALEEATLSFPNGQGGLLTLRQEMRFGAALPSDGATWSGAYQDTNFADRVGWSEVVVRAGTGTGLRESSAPIEDVSDELRSYPTDALQSPPSVTSASFEIVPSNIVPLLTNPSPNSTSYPQSGSQVGNLTALVATPLDGPMGLALALLIALGLGAAHALAPGHGKTIVAAYLVGTRGTAWHAVFLGLTTTVTHTAGVFALGLVTLFVSRFVLPEQIYPWLGVISGLMVTLIGLGLLRARWRLASARSHEAEGLHSHGFGVYHAHAPNDHAKLKTRNLLLLGISGGLIPCPSALVVLLGAIAVGRAGFGLLLVLAFSLGLAVVLTLIGLALIYARRMFEFLPVRGPVFRLLPVTSAIVVVLAGAGVTAQALFSIL